MNKKIGTIDNISISYLTILSCSTFLSIIVIIQIFVLNWEKWAIVPIVVGTIAGWVIHVKNFMSGSQRGWYYVVYLMFVCFFYGIHTERLFDLAIVMAAVMVLVTMLGNINLITMCQLTYYLTLGYGVIKLIIEEKEFDVLVISRIVMNLLLVTMVAWLTRAIIKKWTGILIDAKDDLQEYNESTERLNDFLANVSHEIRTPINAVIGLTGVCIDKEENDSIRNDMISIRSAGRRVAEQIGDILDYSEIDRGKLAKNCEDYMISSVMNDLVMELREYDRHGVELIIDISPEIPSVMNTDVQKLKKIFKALISNGLKYTKEGGVYVKVTTDKHSYGVNLCIEVTDTGIGMTDEELQKVYDRFYQSDSGRARVGGGLGLGLGIVNGFVSLLGGFMTIRSQVGEGTTVHVSLPQTVIDQESCMSFVKPDEFCVGSFLRFVGFKNPHVREYYNSVIFNIVEGLGIQMHRVDSLENLQKLTESVSLTHLFIGEMEYMENREFIENMTSETLVVVVADTKFRLPADSGARIMEKPFYCFPVVSVLNSSVRNKDIADKHMVVKDIHALVVDDEPMNLIVAKSIFKRYGMLVSTAASGPEAIEMCREINYDIIFMDHMMGGMDGVEAMKRIRSDAMGLSKNTPMVALTANAMSSAKQMFLEEGFEGFVSKPIETEELERVMRKILPKECISYVDISEVDEYEGTDAAEDKAETSTDAGSGEGASTTSNTSESAASESGSTDSGKTLRGKLMDAGVDVTTGLNYCAGDFEFYKVILLQFANETMDKIPNMNTFYDEKDWKNYEIIIHAVKSTSKMIGVQDLSDDALALEKAAGESDENYISENHLRVMEKYLKVGDGILEALGENRPEIKPDDRAKKSEPKKTSDSSDDEVLEFGPGSDDEVLEFGPAGDDDVIEFAPVSEE